MDMSGRSSCTRLSQTFIYYTNKSYSNLSEINGGVIQKGLSFYKQMFRQYSWLIDLILTAIFLLRQVSHRRVFDLFHNHEAYQWFYQLCLFQETWCRSHGCVQMIPEYCRIRYYTLSFFYLLSCCILHTCFLHQTFYVLTMLCYRPNRE